MTDLLAQLQPIFRDVLDDPHLLLTRESNATNVPGWDSLAHINLISAIEQDFGVRFTLEELQELKDVRQIVELVQRKLATK